MAVRLIAIDLPVLDLSDRDVAALRRAATERGVQVALVSAQPLADVREMQRQLALSGPLIAERGAHVVDAAGDDLGVLQIPPDAARRILTAARERPLMLTFMRVGGMTYVRPGPKRWWERTVPPPPGTEVVDELEDHVGDGPTLIVATGRDARLLASADGPIEVIVRGRGTEIEAVMFTAQGASRGLALRRLRERLGIERRETLAVVESEEALSLFEDAGVRVARADADDRVLLAADWTASVEDGLAATLDRFVFNSAA